MKSGSRWFNSAHTVYTRLISSDRHYKGEREKDRRENPVTIIALRHYIDHLMYGLNTTCNNEAFVARTLTNYCRSATHRPHTFS